MSSEGRFANVVSTLDNHFRSTWNMNNKWQGAIKHGTLVPMDLTFAMPADTFKYKMNLFIRTATPPIAPIMDSISAYVACFFVPKRLVFGKTKQFYGENVEGYGIQSQVLEPRENTGKLFVAKTSAAANYDKFGVALGYVTYGTLAAGDVKTPINLIQIRSFLQCYNDWFRNENFMPPYLWDHDQTGDSNHVVATISGNAITGTSALPSVCKRLDLFTSCLSWTQKSNADVIIPLGVSAPVWGDPGNTATNNAAVVFNWKNINPVIHDEQAGLYTAETDEGGTGLFVEDAIDPDFVPSFLTKGTTSRSNAGLIADLSNATGANINSLRLAVQTQKFFETLARCGSKYREYIKAMFGVSIGDTSAQMAEYLGGFEVPINIDQVVSHSGYQPGSSTTLGAPGAISVSGASKDLFVKSFSEPGYVVTVLYTKHNRTYGQGLDEFLTKHELFDEYNPKFACIGEQPVKKSALFFDGRAAKDDLTFGFHEYAHEYRYKPDVVLGVLNPAITNSYDFWNLSEKFENAPTLSASFLTEGRESIARCLAGGLASPDYFVDAYIERKVARPMPLFSVPGYMDHF